MTTVRNILAVAAISASAVAFSGAAQACSSGFIANALCNAGVINKSTANALDDAHARMGRPLDHAANYAAGAAVNVVAPGAGVYVTEGLEMRDQYNRGGFAGQQDQSGQTDQGVVVSQPYANNGPAYPQPIRFGNICVTQFGRFAGPVNPLGSFCQVPTPNGVIVGQVGL